RKIYTELIAKGKVTRGWLGVSIQPLTPELAKSFSAKDNKGVLISDVVGDSPAAKAGLQPGDILIEFDGKKMEGPADLQRAVGLANPGNSAKVDRKSTRLNSSHQIISYAVFCLKKKKKTQKEI